MENTTINGEASVLEETYEDVDFDSDTATSASGEESTESDVLSESDTDDIAESGNLAEDERSDESEQGENESAIEDAAETITETVVQTVEVLPDETIAVYLVEEPVDESVISTYAVSGSVYPGTISTTYTDYFAGIADKLSYDEHYVVFRESQYVYRMMWGESLALAGADFSGDALSYCSLTASSYGSDFMVEFGVDSLSLDASGGFVYSNLGDYPSLTEGGTGLEFQTILFAIGFAVVYSVCHDIFDYIMEHVYRK